MENKNIIAALVKAQLEITPPKRTAKNNFHKRADGSPFEYATLDDIYASCRGPLANNGLVLSHTVERCDQQYTLITTLYHVSGETLSNQFPMAPRDASSQSIAAARTYACRYAVCNLLALPNEDDDDGEASMGRSQKNDSKQKESPKPVNHAKIDPRPKEGPSEASVYGPSVAALKEYLAFGNVPCDRVNEWLLWASGLKQQPPEKFAESCLAQDMLPKTKKSYTVWLSRRQPSEALAI